MHQDRAEPQLPYRADHVGSLLRPPALLAARERHQQQSLTRAQLRVIEDDAIRGAVQLQTEAGLTSITDGEFRRTYFHVDFLEQLSGVTTAGQMQVSFHTHSGNVDFAPPVLKVEGPVRHVRAIQGDDFAFLKTTLAPGQTAKVSIPSPTMLHFRGGRAAISEQAYPDLGQFFDDVAAAYRQELKALAALGCRYVQLDDTNLAYLCDERMRASTRSRGDDPDALPLRYARLINAAISPRPVGMTIAVHLCRGNFKSAWAAEGGYEPVAEVLFNELAVDGFSSSTTTPAPATLHRCVSFRKVNGSCSASSAAKRVSWKPPTSSGAGSTRRPDTSRSSSCVCRLSVASPAPFTATRSPRRPSSPSSGS